MLVLFFSAAAPASFRCYHNYCCYCCCCYQCSVPVSIKADSVATSANATADDLIVSASAVTATADVDVATGAVLVVTSAVRVPTCVVTTVAGAVTPVHTPSCMFVHGRCSRQLCFYCCLLYVTFLWVVGRQGMNVFRINGIPKIIHNIIYSQIATYCVRTWWNTNKYVMQTMFNNIKSI